MILFDQYSRLEYAALTWYFSKKTEVSGGLKNSRFKLTGFNQVLLMGSSTW